jgi:hypothetical protein
VQVPTAWPPAANPMHLALVEPEVAAVRSFEVDRRVERGSLLAFRESPVGAVFAGEADGQLMTSAARACQDQPLRLLGTSDDGHRVGRDELRQVAAQRVVVDVADLRPARAKLAPRSA